MTNSDGMELAKLIGRLEGPTVIGPTDREIQAVAYDSRQVGPGSLFVAIRGNKSDGHDFIEQAVSRGAVAVVSERAALTARATNIVVRDSRAALSRIATAFFQNPSRRLRMVGVTGTNGKTTTTFLIKHLLERSGQRTALLGTVAYEIGDRVLPAPRTTPESLDLQQLLAECVQAGCQCVSMEVSSHALALERVEDIEFDAAVFTNLTQDHLDFHGSMKAYFEAKSRLFEKLRRSQDREAPGIINVDDPYGQQLIGRLSKRLSVITYGMGARADFRASNFKVELNGSSYQLDAKERSYLVRLPLIGRFNIYNSLAALATSSALGADLRACVLALAKAPQVPGRLQAVPAKRQFQVFVDYAHTDDALRSVLRTCRDLQPNRTIVVFGCGGDRDRTKRPLMAAAAEEGADYVVVTSDNPRKEDPMAIIRDIKKGFRGKNYEVISDRQEAIHRAIALAQPRDIVLIAGKGHEHYQEFADHTIPFDDVEVAARVLESTPVHFREHGF